ncbi:hypothetical protein U1Q18_007347, partial [Sarracenia purpurea var. burkii]
RKVRRLRRQGEGEVVKGDVAEGALEKAMGGSLPSKKYRAKSSILKLERDLTLPIRLGGAVWRKLLRLSPGPESWPLSCGPVG